MVRNISIKNYFNRFFEKDFVKKQNLFLIT